MRAHKFILGAMLLSISAFGSMYFGGGGGGADATSIARDGTRPPTADTPWGGFKITGLGTPTLVGDAATKAYVDTAAATGIARDGSRPPTANQPWAGFDITGAGRYTSVGGNFVGGAAGNIVENVINGKTLITEDQPGSATYLLLKNTSAVAGAETILDINVASGVGDPRYWASVAGGTVWQMGQDVSDGEKFKIATGTTFGSGEQFSIDIPGKFQIGPTGSDNNHTVWGSFNITGDDVRDGVKVTGTRSADEMRITLKNTANDGSEAFTLENDTGEGSETYMGRLGSNFPVADVPANAAIFHGAQSAWWFINPSGSPHVFSSGFSNSDRRLQITNTEVTSYKPLIISGAGNGLKVAEGADAKMGIATLVAGTVTVSTTAVAADSRIMLTCQDPNGGTPGAEYVSARNAGTDFTINSTSVIDTCIVAWLIVDPS